jgi:signal transduction histidine kinase
MRPQDLRGVVLALGIVVLAVAYVSAALIGFEAAVVAEQVTLVWAPSGIALAALVLGGLRLWPGVLLGAFVANLATSEPVVTAAFIAVGNTLEGFCGTALLRRFGFLPSIRRLRDAIALILLSSVSSTMVSATVGSLTLCATGVQQWDTFGVIWRDWWLGDAVGVLVVAPLLLTWLSSGRPKWSRPRVFEAAFLLSVVSIVSAIAFWPHGDGVLSEYPSHYLAFPIVIWAALRFGPRGTASVVFVAAAAAVVGTTQGFGPAFFRASGERLLLLQLFVSVVATTGLLLGAAIAERNASYRALRLADQKKDEFLATLAHELRNPLAPISSAVALLRDARERAATEQLRSIVERQVANLVRLVDDLLDVSRITSGKVQLQKSSVELASVIGNAVEISRPLIESKHQRLDVDISNAPARLEADPTRLAQVVSNLLNNAATHGADGGRIWLSTHCEADETVIRVRDDGPGMTEEMLEHVFELFAQGPRASQRSGLGVGLTLARHLVTLHGGTIAAASAGPGRGSEFTVRLPAPRTDSRGAPEGALPPAPPALATRTGDLRILVVDDNADAAQMLALLLEERGHLVRVALDGTAALEELEGSAPDVVLLDIEMPGMSGYDVARAVRADPRFADVRMIAVSGYGQARDRERSREAGFDVHMVKPVQVETLYSEVERRSV